MSGPVSGSVELDYDDDFRVAQQTVNGQYAVALSYDADSLLVSAGQLSLTRDPQTGLVTSTALRQSTERYAYNAFGEVTSYQAFVSGTGPPIYSASYVRDAVGRIVDKTETAEAQTRTYSYSYDLAGRLTETLEDGVLNASYDYDPNGNRLARTTSSGTEVGSYDEQDRVLSYGDKIFSYDAHGDLATVADGAGTTQYHYDPFGSLREVVLPVGTIEYLVDGRDRRIAKKVDGLIRRAWIYGDELGPIAELDGTGGVVARFVYTTRRNVPAYMVKKGNTYRFILDHLGSVRLVVDATGAVAQRLDYDEFGRVLSDTRPGFQPFGFAGGLYDPDTGLVRFGARDYDPEVGRWTTKDRLPLRAGDPNFYTYVHGDPVNFVDPRGTDPLSAAIGGALAELGLGTCLGAVAVAVAVPSLIYAASTGDIALPWEDAVECEDAETGEEVECADKSKEQECTERADAAFHLCMDKKGDVSLCANVWAITYRNCMAGF